MIPTHQWHQNLLEPFSNKHKLLGFIWKKQMTPRVWIHNFSEDVESQHAMHRLIVRV